MMAGVLDMKDLSSNSLINFTHFPEEFSSPAYERLLRESNYSFVIQVDKTTHRMLERHEKRNW
jgi:hypothetical protein